MNEFSVGDRMRELALRTMPREDEIHAHFALEERQKRFLQRHRPRFVRIGLAAILFSASCAAIFVLQEGQEVGVAASLGPDLLAHAEAPAKKSPSSDEASNERATLQSPQPRMPSAPDQPLPAGNRSAPSRTTPSPEPHNSQASDDEGTKDMPAGSNWSAVSEALRDRDNSALASALRPLLESEDAEQRDSAWLVQLRVASNGGPLSIEHRAELRRLAESGQTPSIRNEARRLLQQVSLEGRPVPESTPDEPLERERMRDERAEPTPEQERP